MRRLLTTGFIILAVACFAQSDSTRKQIAYSFGFSAAAGFMPGDLTLTSYYGQLITERTAFPSFDVHATVLFREKFGIRLTAGRTGRKTSFRSYSDYDSQANPDFHSLPNYSDLHSGFTYAYIMPQVVYRTGEEPFNLTVIGGAGIGRLSMPTGEVITQRDGSNLFFHIAYDSPVATNLSADLRLEFAYMRQLSQHLFMNAGIYADGFMIAADYKYSVTFHENGVYPVYAEFQQAKHVLMVYNAGLFLNFQWNKRESPRAIYE
jgi:hypothetical protein